jgi:TonB family protein
MEALIYADEMGCPHCSAEVGASDSYCYSCGAKLESSPTSSAGASLQPSESSLALAPRHRGLRIVIVILINLVLLGASAWMAYALLLRYRSVPSVHLGNPRLVQPDGGAHAPPIADATPAVSPIKGGTLTKQADKRARPSPVAATPAGSEAPTSSPDGAVVSTADSSVAGASPDVGRAGGGSSRGGTSRGGGVTSAEQTAGELNADSVRMVVRHYLPQVRACYDRALKQQEGISGVVEIKFEVSEEGRVKSSKVNSNSTGHDGLGRCIATVLRGWKFPRPVGGSAVFIYPFVFSSGG